MHVFLTADCPFFYCSPVACLDVIYLQTKGKLLSSFEICRALHLSGLPTVHLHWQGTWKINLPGWSDYSSSRQRRWREWAEQQGNQRREEDNRIKYVLITAIQVYRSLDVEEEPGESTGIREGEEEAEVIRGQYVTSQLLGQLLCNLFDCPGKERRQCETLRIRHPLRRHKIWRMNYSESSRW